MNGNRGVDACASPHPRTSCCKKIDSVHRYPALNDGFAHPASGQDLRETVGIEHCPTIATGADVVNAFDKMSLLRREVIVAAALDRQSRMIGWSVVAASPAERKLLRSGHVFMQAIAQAAAGVVLVRNCGSRELRSSTEEFRFIHQLARAAETLQVHLVDYILIAPQKWCSLLEQPLAEAHARLVNLSRLTAKRSWKCRRCKAVNQLNGSAVRIHSRYLPSHCRACNTFTWVL